jgi:hypothetical protein
MGTSSLGSSTSRTATSMSNYKGTGSSWVAFKKLERKIKITLIVCFKITNVLWWLNIEQLFMLHHSIEKVKL